MESDSPIRRSEPAYKADPRAAMGAPDHIAEHDIEDIEERSSRALQSFMRSFADWAKRKWRGRSPRFGGPVLPPASQAQIGRRA